MNNRKQCWQLLEQVAITIASRNTSRKKVASKAASDTKTILHDKWMYRIKNNRKQRWQLQMRVAFKLTPAQETKDVKLNKIASSAALDIDQHKIHVSDTDTRLHNA